MCWLCLVGVSGSDGPCESQTYTSSPGERLSLRKLKVCKSERWADGEEHTGRERDQERKNGPEPPPSHRRLTLCIIHQYHTEEGISYNAASEWLH